MFGATPAALPADRLLPDFVAVPTRKPGPALDPTVDDRLLEVFRRAADPGDPMQLRDLYLGRVEAELGRHSHREDLAEYWRRSTPLRSVSVEEVLGSRATVRFVKELFNYYYRDDLYGDLRPTAEVILSSGAVDESHWGLPGVLKDCITHALTKDWYGYSDSRGRAAAREAVAAYESARLGSEVYGPGNVAITMGATFAISSLADFILDGSTSTAPALCAIPNYPPLVESIARRHQTQLVPLTAQDGISTLRPLIDALRPDTPLVLLQTAANPTGALVPEHELAELIATASPTTMIVLDECHEWLGPDVAMAAARTRANVVRVSSLSKTWSVPGLKVGWVLADRRFIDEYYEYASSSFGGPPSFFATLVEVLAVMERWLLTGVDEPSALQLKELAEYSLDSQALRRAYRGYRADRQTRTRSLTVLRDAVTERLDLPGISVMSAAYSINLALRFDRYDDSYRLFRDVLRETGVSLFPGVLTFCLSGGFSRVTTALPWDTLSLALDRLRQHQKARFD